MIPTTEEDDMSNETDDGGPAFPATTEHGCNNGVWGMMLRDYFAAKAMQSYIAHLSGSGNGAVSRHYDEAACESYLIADSMLRARKEKPL